MHKSSRPVYWPDGTSIVMDNEDQRERIRNLKPGILQKSVVGAIIAKQDARSFPDKKNPSQLRWQINFTLRDSPFDFINVTCWGGEIFIKDVASSCRIGYNVEISNVIIQTKQCTEAEEKYSPWTPSDFNIVANEPHARIALHNSAAVTSFASFAFLPVKDGNDYYKLGDIVANGHNLDSLHVNILAAVRNAGCSKEVTTKSGKTIWRREVQIFDETCSCFTLTIWDNELNWLADDWKSCETVLFFVDAKVYFDQYRKRMVAVCDGKTIVTVNPDVPDAHGLYSYMQSASEMFCAQFDDHQDDGILLKDIHEKFTVNKLQTWIDESTDQCIIHGIINGCVTNFNIDTSQQDASIFISRCNSCKAKIENGLQLCQNISCSDKQQNQSNIEKQLNLKVDVSDATGGIQNLRLRGNVAERIIGFTAHEINSMEESQKTELKWKFLMERFKIHFKCSRYKDDKRMSFLDILSMQLFENQKDSTDLL